MKLKSNTVWLLLAIPFVYFLFELSLFLSPTKQDSSLYLLSALAQSQAAIFVIILGFDFLAPSNLASTYSLRIATLLNSRSNNLWVPFAFSIFFDIILMAFLEFIPHPFRFFAVLIAILIAIIIFAFIFIYMKDAVQKIENPLSLIESYSQSETEITNQDIFDFIRGSLNINDMNGFKRALSLYYMKDISQMYSGSSSVNETDGLTTFKEIIKNIIHISTCSNNIKEEHFVCLCLKISSCYSYIPDSQKTAYFKVIYNSISKLPEQCIKLGYEDAAIQGINMIVDMYEQTEQNQISSTIVFKYLCSLGASSAKMDLDNATSNIVNNITYSLQNIENITEVAISQVAVVGLFCAEHRLIKPCDSIISLLGEMSNLCDSDKIDTIIDYLGAISLTCFEHHVYSSNNETFKILDSIQADYDSMIKIDTWVSILKSHDKGYC